MVGIELIDYLEEPQECVSTYNVVEVLRMVVAIIEVHNFEDQAQGLFVVTVLKSVEDIDEVGFVFVDRSDILLDYV